jgi:hypothetical protein
MSGVILVVFGLLFQEIDHCSGAFFFFIILFFGCVQLLCRYGNTLLQRLGVTDISAMLVYAPCRKKNPTFIIFISNKI